MEAPPIRDDGLQIDEHRRFQEKFWSWERGAWVVFAALVLLALLGLTGGGGPLETTRAALGNGSVEYPRIARLQAPSELVLRPEAGTAAEYGLLLGPQFWSAFQVDEIRPAPIRSETSPEGHKLIFDSSGGDILFRLKAQTPGTASFDVTGDGAAPLRVSIFVLP